MRSKIQLPVVTYLISLSFVCPYSTKANFGDGNDQGAISPPFGSNQSSFSQTDGSIPKFAPINTGQQIARDEINSRMQRQMRAVSEWIHSYCLRNSLFPEYGNQMNEAKAQLLMLVPDNPYRIRQNESMPSNLQPTSEDWTLAAQAGTSDSGQRIAQGPDRIRLFRDDSLTKGMLSYYSEHAPSDWQAPAGTITCVGNNVNGLILVWGAGMNNQPLRDPLTGKVFIVSGSWEINSKNSTPPSKEQ